MWKEFKEFAFKGNILDLAVAVVIGTAFSAIVTSFVDDLIMPLVGALLVGVNFTHLTITIGDATILYGNFIQSFVNFFIIALSIFLAIRVINRLKREKELEEEAIVEEVSTTDELLTEIRDLLKEKK